MTKPEIYKSLFMCKCHSLVSCLAGKFSTGGFVLEAVQILIWGREQSLSEIGSCLFISLPHMVFFLDAAAICIYIYIYRERHRYKGLQTPWWSIYGGWDGLKILQSRLDMVGWSAGEDSGRKSVEAEHYSTFLHRETSDSWKMLSRVYDLWSFFSLSLP